jgi:signal transduction histidine kinase/ActR/RegA family two-component response regulator
MVAEARHRGLAVRMALAAFIGVTAWFLIPSIWPAVWYGAVVATQVADWAVFRPFRRHPEREPSPTQAVLAVLSTLLSVTAYGAITAYVWFYGGETGRVFAMIQCAGGLLHVSLHMHRVRPVLTAAAAVHATYFLGLPLVSMIVARHPVELFIVIGAVLYMSHLVVAVRQSSAATGALTAANEDAHEARRRAEIASAAKSDFLAVISHEIRTPMNAVISAANLLRRTRLDHRQREHVSMLIDAGDVLMGLLNDVLDVSKIEAGKMTLESADMAVRDRLAALHRLWEPKAVARGVRLKLSVAPETPTTVRTDPLRVQQILFNLISNAVKFTDEGEIVVSCDWADGRLTVAVRDTGCGVPAARLAQVFDSFEQAEAGTTRRYGGTGLGLSISRRLAEMMGGSLTAESVEGEGSIFTLSLPLQAVEASAPRARDVTVDADGLVGRSILAADDHEVNRRILTLLLEPHGCRLTLVENGAEAVEAASVERFDAILMDMQMPVMDGLQAARELRQGGANADTPVIALTANALDTHRAAWEAVGVHAFLTKPIDPTLLAETLAQACATRAAPDATVAA